MPDLNSQAILSSPIACEYLAHMQAKEQSRLLALQQQEKDALKTFAQWEEFQKYINSNAILRKQFLSYQKEFLTNPNSVALHPKFAQAILALHLDPEE